MKNDTLIAVVMLKSLYALLLSPWAMGQVEAQRSSAEVDAAVQVIRGLRDRRLFELADIYATDQLNSEAIGRNQKSLIVLEQIQLLVAKAISNSDQDRESSWKAAEQIISRFQKEFPNDPKILLVQVQDALVYFSHGNLIQQELDAEIVAADYKSRALAQFRIAMNKFKDIEKQVVSSIPAAKPVTNNGELNQDQLINLKNNLRYRMALVNLAKAQLYEPTDRLNRIDALSQVLIRLDEVITQSNSELPLWWEAQISKAKCLRLMRNGRGFNQLLNSLPKKLLNGNIQQKLLTERVLAFVDTSDASQSKKLLDEYMKLEKPSPQLRLAVLRLLMASASRAEGVVKQERQKQATDLVKTIEQFHGKYWGRRAEIVLVGAVASGSPGNIASSDLEILIRQGNNAFRKKNFEDAIKAYAKATQFAIDADQGAQALANAVRQAQSHEQLKQHAQAADALFNAAERFVDVRSADAVYLRGCWNLGQTADNPALMEKLRFLVERWTNLPTANQARLWLGNALEREKQWQSSLETYLAIPFDSPFAIDANRRIGAVAKFWLHSIEQTGGKTAATARQIVNLLGSKIEPPKDWNEAKQMRCVAMTETALKYEVLEPIQVLYFLESIILSDVQAIESVKVWNVVANAKHASTKSEDADSLMNAIRTLPNEEESLKACLLGIKDCLDEKQITAVADAIVTICNKAMVNGNEKDKDFWSIEKAIAESNSRSAGGSNKSLADLAQKFPQSLRIQLAYARALTKEDNSEAIHQWRRLGSKVKKGSEAWYEAKYNVVQLMVSAGEKVEAAKLVKYLEATTSNWNKSTWKSKFKKLVR